MTCRERFITAVSHREPDRVPISFGGTLSSGILECPPNGNGYSSLCRLVGITDAAHPDIGHIGNFVGNLDERLLERFRSDFRRVDPNPQPVLTHRDGSKTLLGTLCGLKVRNTGVYDDVYDYPLKNARSPADLDSYPYWPTTADFARLGTGKRDSALAWATSGYVVVVDTLLSFPFLMYPLLAGFEKWFLDMKENPRFYHALSERLLEVAFGIVHSFVAPLGDCIDMICTYDDLGSQEGLFFSLQDYRIFVRPYEERLLDHIRSKTEAIIYRHCCGAISEVIPDFIEMGVEVLNPIQPLARGMQLDRLKREYGKDLTFFGGIDTQQLLPRRSPREVRQDVRRTIRSLGKEGGYVFGPATNIEPDTPPENVVAMYDAAFEYGAYPLSVCASDVQQETSPE